MRLDVSRAGGADLAAVAGLLRAIEAESPSTTTAPTTTATAAARAVASLEEVLAGGRVLDSDHFHLLVARADELPVAYATCVVIPKLDARRAFLFVDELHVLASHRRRGVGRSLVDACLQLARELDCHGVRLLSRPENEAAQALYRRAGFTRHGTVFWERVDDA